MLNQLDDRIIEMNFLEVCGDIILVFLKLPNNFFDKVLVLFQEERKSFLETGYVVGCIYELIVT